MYCIGLTGNIASGKSTALDYFKKQGAFTISADESARQVTTPGQSALVQIVERFGNKILLPNGNLNRKTLRRIIFKNPEQRQWLENLLHPLIRKNIEQQLAKAIGNYCVIEIPLLTDRAPYPYLNRVLAIIAPQQQTLERIMARDNCLAADAQAIINAQPDEQNRRMLADDILENKSSLDEFLNELNQLHKKYLRLAHEAK